MSNLTLLKEHGHCFNYTRVFSDGVWNLRGSRRLLLHSLVRLHVHIIVIFAIATIIHSGLRCLKFPRLTSEILTGFILGDTVVGNILNSWGQQGENENLLFPKMPQNVLVGLSKIGYSFFIFLIGVRMDPSFIIMTGRKVVIIGIALCFFPTAMSLSIDISLMDTSVSSNYKQGATNSTIMYIGSILMTDFVSVSHILMQLKIINSRVGRLALAISLVNALTKVALSIIGALMKMVGTARAQVVYEAVFISLLYVISIVFILRPIILWFIRRTPEGMLISEHCIAFVIACMLCYATASEFIGLPFFYGPFLVGLVVPSGSPLATVLIKKFDAVTNGFLLPILATSAATNFDLLNFLHLFEHILTFQASLVCYMIKIIITFLLVLPIHIPLKEGIALSLILNAKGIYEIGILLNYCNIQSRSVTNTSGIFLVLILATIVPLMVKVLYNPRKQYVGHKKKSIQHGANSEELIITTCVYKQEDALAAVKLLDYLSLSKSNSLTVFGLYLEELVSTATPLLLDHELGQKIPISEGSRSQAIIDIFKYFKTKHNKVAQVHMFTAISPLKLLHEDICWLAFDKAVSLVILPFHKKWNSKGKLVFDNSDIRKINIDVLDRAPCSVAILVDRRSSRGLSSIFDGSSTYRVCVVFFGGPDDREALAIATKMLGSNKIELTVLRFVCARDQAQNRWESILDSECLRSLRHGNGNRSNLHFIEENVKDASETAASIQVMQQNFDLMLVGRRHEEDYLSLSGLGEWADLPELGPIGDQLASEDCKTGISVLIVQQQILKASHSSVLNG